MQNQQYRTTGQTIVFWLAQLLHNDFHVPPFLLKAPLSQRRANRVAVRWPPPYARSTQNIFRHAYPRRCLVPRDVCHTSPCTRYCFLQKIALHMYCRTNSLASSVVPDSACRSSIKVFWMLQQNHNPMSLATATAQCFMNAYSHPHLELGRLNCIIRHNLATQV